MASGYEPKIWNFLYRYIGNNYGVAALMGNLYAESGLHPNIVQGDVPISNYSVEYTAKVDNGTISEYDFVHNGPGGGGYGLAQWTFYTRKQDLYTTWKNNPQYTSIGDIDLQLNFLYAEMLVSYSGVWNTLCNTKSIREASDKVLHDFENPAYQSTSVEEYRASLGQQYYNYFVLGTGTLPGGGTVDPEPDTPTPTPTQRKKMSLILQWAATRRRF